jgi:hypothetical protein
MTFHKTHLKILTALSQLSYFSHCKKVGLEPTTSGLAGKFLISICCLCLYLMYILYHIFYEKSKKRFSSRSLFLLLRPLPSAMYCFKNLQPEQLLRFLQHQQLSVSYQ